MASDVAEKVANKERSIALVGMMGAGKSTVGHALATRLNREFADSDALIEARAGKTVAEIFADEGEKTFREWEVEEISRVLTSGKPMVVGVAGGAPLRPEIRSELKAHAKVVWLRVPIDILIKRVSEHPDTRPVIAKDPDRIMRELYGARVAVYAQIADEIIDSADETPEQVVAQILEQLK